MPPEDVSNSRTSRILLAGGSEVSAQAEDGPWSPEKRKVGALQVFSFSWQHEVLLSRKGEVD